MLSHYHFWEACREDRSQIEQAVDEALRWRATDPVFPRLCVEDAEVEGVLVPAGSRVYLCLGAANHDPAVFERPDDYDIFRPKEHHMGFGFGPHRCLGMDVARQEMVLNHTRDLQLLLQSLTDAGLDLLGADELRHTHRGCGMGCQTFEQFAIVAGVRLGAESWAEIEQTH